MLTSTSYGTALLVKVVIVIVLIALGALNRRRSMPRLGRDEGSMLLRRVVAVELVAAVGVFGLTGTLTSLNPNTLEEPASGTRRAEVAATGSDFATTARVSLTARPGTAGPNSFAARITDFDDGTPVEADEVSVTLAPIGRPEIEPTTLELEPATADAAPASWTAAGTQLSIAGAWDAVVQVRAGARVTEVPLVLVTRAPPTTSVIAQGSDELPDIETFTLATGEQLQLYLDPGQPGSNEFHVTAFDGEGQELPLSGLVVVAVAPGGDGEALDVTRLTPGHFVAPVETDAGRWRFEVVATTEGGTVLQATQDQEVGA
jgi:nitrogen fixation protein FixH